MNFNLDQMAAAARSDVGSSVGELSLPKAVVGALGGALVVGLLYGLVGRFLHIEYSVLAVAIGSASGLMAVRLGGRPSPVAGGVAALASLAMVLAAKVLIGPPLGAGWLAYHLTPFDLAFCYVANPIAAFAAGGTGAGRGLLSKLPF